MRRQGVYAGRLGAAGTVSMRGRRETPGQQPPAGEGAREGTVVMYLQEADGSAKQLKGVLLAHVGVGALQLADKGANAAVLGHSAGCERDV